MALAIFDLDNTLIGGDSDHSWGEFLVAKGVVDSQAYKEANDRFYADYQSGSLDIYAYQEFALAPLVGRALTELHAWHAAFMTECIEPIMLPKAFELLEKHRQQGDELLIITATNRFITEPIAKRLGINELIATEPEMANGLYTGRVAGTASFQEGKITRLHEWLANREHRLEEAWFYSDSRNDIPLLEAVGNAVAVDADPVLTEHAQQKGWPCISLR